MGGIFGRPGRAYSGKRNLGDFVFPRFVFPGGKRVHLVASFAVELLILFGGPGKSEVRVLKITRKQTFVHLKSRAQREKLGFTMFSLEKLKNSARKARREIFSVFLL